MKTPIRAVIGLALAISASPVYADSKAEIALMKKVFAEIQPLSFKRNREYCGYIGYDFDGNLVASEARRGRKSSCRPRDPVELEVIIASYHTHGAYNNDEGSEVPSVEDMEGDEAEHRRLCRHAGRSHVVCRYRSDGDQPDLWCWVSGSGSRLCALWRRGDRDQLHL